MKNLNSFLLRCYEVSEVFAVIYVVMFVIESFYPMGDLVRDNFGVFGTFVGHLLAIYGWVGIIHFVIRKLESLSDEDK